jgi:hypothetical protein
MIYLYDSYERIPKASEEPNGAVRAFCSFDGEDSKIPGFLVECPQARSLLHLMMDGYVAAEPEERERYWREITENVVDWMVKKGIVELVS